MARDEVEAAYFTLLRAREEVAALHRYDEYLAAEAERLRRVVSEGAALREHISAQLLRRIAHTDQSLQEAIETRLRLVAEERPRLPERIDAAEAFVRTCELEYDALRRGG